MMDDSRKAGSSSGDDGDVERELSSGEHDATLSSSDHEGMTIDLGAGASPGQGRLPAAIGGYRVIGVLGEGGMGIVYEAEQASPRRRVALKVIRGGQFVDETRVKMFQREADTLARLKHPNIGGIYESGRTEDGQHFFAMELVLGKTLGAYLRDRPQAIDSAELEHRLALFQSVCDAVQYAHQRGVIHRDLKPSNIIVTDQSSQSGVATSTAGAAAPTVKILDFGLARITEGDLALTQITEIGVIKGTLPYMSPEQARGDVEGIDIRTDVYALGVILYEMLAGRRPYDTARSALLEAVRVICEEPPAPLASTWSGSCKLDPDVATIVGTALEKEPDRRYASAAALSEDVGRFLASQPILARPPSAVYQLRKMVSRHRTVFATSLAMAMVLVVSSVVSTSLYFKARRESERARIEALKSHHVANFMTGMLEGVGPSVALGRDTTMLREVLDRTAERIGTELTNEPEVEANVRSVLGSTYRDLGELEKAEAQQSEAVAKNRRVLGDDDGTTLISIHDLAVTLQDLGRYEQAEGLFNEALAGMRRVLGDDDRNTLMTIGDLGQLIAETGRLAEAEPYHRESLEGLRRIEGPEGAETMTALSNLGVLLHSMGRYVEAEATLREALEIKRRVLGNDHPETLICMNSLGVVLNAEGKYDEAEALYVESVDGYRRVVGDEHKDTLRALANLGVFLTERGRPDEGERYLQQALETRRRVLGDDHFDTLVSINTMGFWYYRQGRYDESEAMIREALERGRRVLGSDHPDFLVWVFNMGQLLQLRGRLAEAEPYDREVVDTFRRTLGLAHPRALQALGDLAELVDKLGRPQEAESLLLEGLAAARRDNGEADESTTATRAQLAAFYRSHDRMAEARAVVADQLTALRDAATASNLPGPKNAFAWEALTCEPADLQEPAAALSFALAAAELGQWRDPDVLDTLALAYHSTGDQVRAVEIASRALDLIPAEDRVRRQPFEATLARYREALADGSLVPLWTAD